MTSDKYFEALDERPKALLHEYFQLRLAELRITNDSGDAETTLKTRAAIDECKLMLKRTAPVKFVPPTKTAWG